jgi:hypothetical protein
MTYERPPYYSGHFRLNLKRVPPYLPSPLPLPPTYHPRGCIFFIRDCITQRGYARSSWHSSSGERAVPASKWDPLPDLFSNGDGDGDGGIGGAEFCTCAPRLRCRGFSPGSSARNRERAGCLVRSSGRSRSS